RLPVTGPAEVYILEITAPEITALPEFSKYGSLMSQERGDQYVPWFHLLPRFLTLRPFSGSGEELPADFAGQVQGGMDIHIEPPCPQPGDLQVVQYRGERRRRHHPDT